MKYREIYLEKDLTLADSGSKTVEIAVVDPISELYIKLYATNGATSNKGSPIARCISKVEVFDGADKLFSMDGRLAHALAYYRSERIPMTTLNSIGSYVQSVHIPIRFGRRLWDHQLALVPQAFRNLQLKITWDLAAINAVGATGFVTGSGKMSVIARVMEGVDPAPTAFIMSKDHFSFTSAASGDERVSLPTDFPYIDLMVRAFESGVDVTDSITNLKLSLDFDKDIPFDLTTVDIKGRMIEMFGEVELPHFILSDDAEAHESWVGIESNISAVSASADIIVSCTTLSGGKYTLQLLNDAGVAQNAKTVFTRILGQVLWNCYYHGFGNLDDPTSYLAAPEHGDIKVHLTQGNAGAECNIVLSQLRSYAK
ncbi:MAG: hypothetical protein AAB706_04295 [Patescibacteria group bacterium]